MFTGLIEAKGQVACNELSQGGRRLVIHATEMSALEDGESIALQGVCLTLLPMSASHLVFDLSPETLKLTTLGELRVGDYVNIERAMHAGARFGGHYVSGHVDTTAYIYEVVKQGEYMEMFISGFSETERQYLLPKGSITLDGVSLTINEVNEGVIKVMLIPHTLAVTTLGQAQKGQRVNVEFDYLTRVIAHQLSTLNLKIGV